MKLVTIFLLQGAWVVTIFVWSYDAQCVIKLWNNVPNVLSGVRQAKMSSRTPPETKESIHIDHPKSACKCMDFAYFSVFRPTTSGKRCFSGSNVLENVCFNITHRCGTGNWIKQANFDFTVVFSIFFAIAAKNIGSTHFRAHVLLQMKQTATPTCF